MAKADGSKLPGEKARPWRRDEGAEQILEKYTSATVIGYAWVRLKDIDFVTDDNARLGRGRVIPELVAAYKADMKGDATREPDVFPAVVLMERPHRPYAILGGYTRTTCARELGDEWVFALVVAEMSETDAAPARARLNMDHGQRESPEAIYQLATMAVIQKGIGVKPAAARYGISSTTLGSHVRAERVRIEMSQHGIDLKGFGVEFVKLIEHDSCPVRVALASLLVAARKKLKLDAWKVAVKQVKEQKSEAAALARVDTLRAELCSIIRKKPLKQQRGEKLASALGTAEYQFEAAAADLSRADMTPEVFDVIRDRWLRLCARMRRLLGPDAMKEAS